MNATAVAQLGLMAALMFASAWNDTIIHDETAHLAAGYSYLRKADYRFNPEHPPLMKDLGALPLLFMNLRPPWNDKSWTEDPYGQWTLGSQLLYNSGGNPDTITRAIKAPMILFTVALGGVLFWWTRKQFGAAAALLALFFYVFSPTFLAHGRFVTTDVGAAAGFFIGTIAYLRFLKNPSWTNVLLAGLAMGFAFLTKFSAVLLVPAAFLLALVWALVHPERRLRLTGLVGYLALTTAVFVIAVLTIYPVYLHHTWNYPPERQRADTLNIITMSEMHGELKGGVLWASDKPLLRPWSEYGLGMLLTFKRSKVGNQPFFLGEIFSAGQRFYFPFVYFVKEPLALHLLTLLALAFGISRCLQPSYRREWLAAHFTEIAFLLVIAVYWLAAINSHLNIGVRHLLPAFPFVYMLVANELATRDRHLAGQAESFPTDVPGTASHAAPARRAAALRGFRLMLGALLAWQAVSVLRAHPAYLAYFNELAGGPDGGWQYVVDSNIDWGQDLMRLGEFVERQEITEIHLDYFGAADAAYYLKEKFRGMGSCDAPVKGWVAVSAMWYADSRRKPECDYRRWLPIDKLSAKIGYSIFVFHID
ncbi:MAG: glycosyltransferase family 39 protein [Acidobacteria bacterium]|nr:glycosyltransferase family 39 protein [Acidobacteriota bacterium]